MQLPPLLKGHGTRERLPRAARPRRRVRPDVRIWCARSATGTPASARTACCAWCAPRRFPSRPGRCRRPSTSWTTATPTGPRRRDVRQRHPGVHAIPAVRRARRYRHGDGDARRAAPGARSQPDGDVTTCRWAGPAVLADAAGRSPPRPLAPRHRARRVRDAEPARRRALGEAADLDVLDLTRPPAVEPPLPDGQNVEFVVDRGPRQLRDAGARTRRRGDPLLRHRHLRRGGRARLADGGRRPTARPGGSTCPGGTCAVVWHPTARSS